MIDDTDLEKLERSTFHTSSDDGLWDVFLATVLLMWSLAALLSETLGDFWSSAVFLPVLGLTYVIIKLIRVRVVAPRVGVVRFGDRRKQRLRRFVRLMVAANLLALLAGIIVAQSVSSNGWVVPIAFSLMVLALFSTAAHLLDMRRLFLYGLMLAMAPLVGEWLFREGVASHHGFPITFGVAAAVVALTGLVRFWRLMSRTQPAESPATSGEPDDR